MLISFWCLIQADAAVYKFRPKRVEITVEDIVDGSPHDQNFLLRYNAPVHLPEDILHPKGWNFQVNMDNAARHE